MCLQKFVFHLTLHLFKVTLTLSLVTPGLMSCRFQSEFRDSLLGSVQFRPVN